MPNSQQVSRELLTSDVICDWRPKAGVRLSPHFYTTDDEIEFAIGLCDAIVEEQKTTA
jgi:kynureninase